MEINTCYDLWLWFNSLNHFAPLISDNPALDLLQLEEPHQNSHFLAQTNGKLGSDNDNHEETALDEDEDEVSQCIKSMGLEISEIRLRLNRSISTVRKRMENEIYCMHDAATAITAGDGGVCSAGSSASSTTGGGRVNSAVAVDSINPTRSCSSNKRSLQQSFGSDLAIDNRSNKLTKLNTNTNTNNTNMNMNMNVSMSNGTFDTMTSTASSAASVMQEKIILMRWAKVKKGKQAGTAGKATGNGSRPVGRPCKGSSG